MAIRTATKTGKIYNQESQSCTIFSALFSSLHLSLYGAHRLLINVYPWYSAKTDAAESRSSRGEETVTLGSINYIWQKACFFLGHSRSHFKVSRICLLSIFFSHYDLFTNYVTSIHYLLFRSISNQL